MSLRNTTPLTFHPRGLSDALDSSLVFPGAMLSLKDLIPDPSTKGLWQCRPAALQIGDVGSSFGAFTSGFTDGFEVTNPFALPTPIGVVSCLIIVGDVAYGMVGAGGVKDYPFAFNLKTNVFIDVGGVTTNLPNQQPTSGDWTPPTMDVVGSTILVTHPGFTGTGFFLGTIDISTPTAPVWSAGNFTFGSDTSFFDASTGVPVAVKVFNGRAYWAYNPISGPSATVFSDVLNPLVATNTINLQAITYEDNVPITALGALPLSNQLGGIIQSLMVFKGVSNIYQVTGDLAVGSPPLGTLVRNSLNVATGTFAHNSIAATPKGLAFVAPDGVRIIDFNAQVSDPIGNDGMGKTMPFLLAVAPTRIAAAANGTIYRVSVQDGALNGSPRVEYWLDFSRAGIWSGPHSLPARVIKPYKTTFITAPWSHFTTAGLDSHDLDGKLFKSDYLQSQSSTFTEAGLAMSFDWLTTLMPDIDQMCENNMLETTLYLGMASGGVYSVQALNESGSILNSAILSNPNNPVLWGGFTWGNADWGGHPSALFPQRIAWTRPVVFRRMAIHSTGLSSQQFRIGTLHMKYEKLGYLQQPLGSAA